jgi:hypothetical protein
MNRFNGPGDDEKSGGNAGGGDVGGLEGRKP